MDILNCLVAIALRFLSSNTSSFEAGSGPMVRNRSRAYNKLPRLFSSKKTWFYLSLIIFCFIISCFICPHSPQQSGHITHQFVKFKSQLINSFSSEYQSLPTLKFRFLQLVHWADWADLDTPRPRPAPHGVSVRSALHIPTLQSVRTHSAHRSTEKLYQMTWVSI